MNGNSQAVRIPAEFRLDTDRVEIRRTPDGDLVLHPVPRQRGAALLAALDGFDEDFIAQLEADQADALPMQDRDPLS
jgi:antitoxin VapB